MMRPLVIISGPTATGKSRIAVELAKRINGEIISADSMQVYKHMDIGSAKITNDEMQGIKHYLVDILEPSEEFNVAVFKDLATRALEEIYANGKIPIIAGGTGFYIQAVLYDIDFTKQNIDESYREELKEYVAQYGPAKLHDMLRKVDPKSADAINQANIKRVIRALEFYKLSGYPISEHNETERAKESPYNYAYFVLTDDRNKMYDAIDTRVDKMQDMGLVQEVKRLKDMGYKRGMVAMEGLGYKEILSYLDGEISLEEALYIIKRDTRHFAKRQLTWFRREQDVIWLDKTLLTSEAAILGCIEDNLKKKEIIC